MFALEDKLCEKDWRLGARPPSQDRADASFQDGGVFWLASLCSCGTRTPQGSAALASLLLLPAREHLAYEGTAVKVLPHHLAREGERARYLLMKGNDATCIGEELRCDLEP